jgi:glucokinase
MSVRSLRADDGDRAVKATPRECRTKQWMSSVTSTKIFSMLLAGDVGGTKTLLGLFAPSHRPKKIDTRSFRTLDFPDLASMALEFLREVGVDSAELSGLCFGVAGPVERGRATARLTNVPWIVDAESLRRKLPVPRADVINDLEALAWSVPVLEASEVEPLWAGQPDTDGGLALIAAGTGLGIALLPRVDGRLVPLASEGGHVDFAPRTEPEQTVHAGLIREFGRAELEQVVSGPGLVNIHRFVDPHQCRDLRGAAPGDDLAALISRAALESGCERCRAILNIFVSAYGAAAGNLALTALATGGVFIGGGIAPRILEALRWPTFMTSFQAKAPLEHVIVRVPVRVILNPGAGLLGAACFAARAAGCG